MSERVLCSGLGLGLRVRVGAAGLAPAHLYDLQPATADANGNVAMSREEAHSLDVFPLGRLMHYMLTGVPPGMDILQVSSPTPLSRLSRRRPHPPPLTFHR